MPAWRTAGLDKLRAFTTADTIGIRPWADVLVHDLPKARGAHSHINIKLDTCGGLTEGLTMAEIARAVGLGLMVGCMTGTSLAMAPATLLGQPCEFVDPAGLLLLLAEDSQSAVAFRGGSMESVAADLLGLPLESSRH